MQNVWCVKCKPNGTRFVFQSKSLIFDHLLCGRQCSPLSSSLAFSMQCDAIRYDDIEIGLSEVNCVVSTLKLSLAVNLLAMMAVCVRTDWKWLDALELIENRCFHFMLIYFKPLAKAINYQCHAKWDEHLMFIRRNGFELKTPYRRKCWWKWKSNLDYNGTQRVWICWKSLKCHS